MPKALVACPGCGTRYPPHDGPLHRYIGASAACWSVYGALLVGEAPEASLLERSKPATLGSPIVPHGVPEHAAELLADAYAAQHHGDHSPQAVQSVAVHLLTLHAVLRTGASAAGAVWARGRALRTRGVFHPLQPPPLGAALGIRHLYPGVTGGPYTRAQYVASVFDAWERLHAGTIGAWFERYVVQD